MATIVTPGQLPADKEVTTECNNCGTLFTFTRGEAKEGADDRFGRYLEVVCPLTGCGKNVVVPL